MVPAQGVREKLHELLGLEAIPSDVEFIRGEPEQQEDALIESRVAYRNSLRETVPGILLLPVDAGSGAIPGVVCVSGTGGDAERVTHPEFHLGAEDTGPLFGWGRELARRGYAALSITIKGTESRRKSENDWGIEAKLLAPYGRTQMGVVVEEALSAARLLAGLDGVDPDRVGLTGFSLGGNAAWYGMACDPRIRTAVAMCGGVGSMARGIHEGDPERHSSYWYVPHMLRYFDHPEIVSACICPRPFMVIAPTRDEDMPRSGVDELIRVVRPAYDASGHPEHFEVIQPEANHVFRIEYFERMVDWLRTHL